MPYNILNLLRRQSVFLRKAIAGFYLFIFFELKVLAGPCDSCSLQSSSRERTHFLITSPPPPPPIDTEEDSIMTADAHLPSSKDVFCNAAAGVIAAAFVCPLDVIKTRFQVHGCQVLPVQILKCNSWEFRTDISKGGITRHVPWAITYHAATASKLGMPTAEIHLLLSATIDASQQLSIGANSGAGAATTVATNPLWVVKTRLHIVRSRLQEQGHHSESGILCNRLH